jgi:hypothetical protein
MSFVAEIVKQKSATELAPCPHCHSAIRWVDIYDVVRCKGCHSPPSRLFIARIETLGWWDIPDRSPEWITIWERTRAPIDDLPPFRDPFRGELPPGWRFAAGNRSEFGCRHRETREVPCRGGEWVRVECVGCNRPLELRDAPKSRQKLVI